MKILISADLEGICGVSSWVQVMPPELGELPASTVEYERARGRMTKEVNAAVEGALSAGATDIIVNDSHDGMRNLIPEDLHPEVRFVTGSDKPFGMMQGISKRIDAVFFVGYHAKAGTPNAPLAHTWTSRVNDVRLNGVSTGEFGINAAIAGHFGVPVALVTGDDKAVQQVKDLLGETVIGVAVKEGLSTFSALHLHPEKAQAEIRLGAEKALRHLTDMKPLTFRKGLALELDFDHQARADQCVYIPGVKRRGERTVAFRAKDAVEMMTTFRALMRASTIAMSP